MPRTKHAVIVVIAILVILIGVLITVLIQSKKTETLVLPAAVVFSQQAPTPKDVIVIEAKNGRDEARNSLIRKFEGSAQATTSTE